MSKEPIDITKKTTSKRNKVKQLTKLPRVDLDTLWNGIISMIQKDLMTIQVELLSGAPLPPEYCDRIVRYGKLTLDARNLEYKLAKDANYENLSDEELNLELKKLMKQHRLKGVS